MQFLTKKNASELYRHGIFVFQQQMNTKEEDSTLVKHLALGRTIVTTYVQYV